MQATPRVALHYLVDRAQEDWVLSEDPVPESRPHDIAADLLKLLLLAWAARQHPQRRLQIGRNLAVRWDQAHPQIDSDPDWWMTGEEAQRAAAEAERRAKEEALRRVAELEAKLAARG
jgi:hypothetical protein